jgi:hypothetical protein
MNSNTIKRWQAAKLNRTIHPAVGYLYRLRAQMQKVGFLPNDPLFKRVCATYDAMHGLFVELHYLSCDGAGPSSRK